MSGICLVSLRSVAQRNWFGLGYWEVPAEISGICWVSLRSVPQQNCFVLGYWEVPAEISGICWVSLRSVAHRTRRTVPLRCSLDTAHLPRAFDGVLRETRGWQSCFNRWRLGGCSEYSGVGSILGLCALRLACVRRLAHG